MANMDMDVELVIDKKILDKIIEHDKYNDFLKFWLAEKDTKAVILKSGWGSFKKEWEQSLRERTSEFKELFFAGIRGIVTPYRDKYAEDIDVPEEYEEPQTDPISETARIVNRHYATVKYLVVGDPSEYSSQDLKINPNRIVTAKTFFTKEEVINNKLIQDFKKLHDYK